jgi:hypothetical protein
MITVFDVLILLGLILITIWLRVFYTRNHNGTIL